jgi:hypothetical protein
MGEKGFDFGSAHVSRGLHLMKGDETFDPLDIAFFLQE